MEWQPAINDEHKSADWIIGGLVAAKHVNVNVHVENLHQLAHGDVWQPEEAEEAEAAQEAAQEAQDEPEEDGNCCLLIGQPTRKRHQKKKPSEINSLSFVTHSATTSTSSTSSMMGIWTHHYNASADHFSLSLILRFCQFHSKA